MEEKFITNTYTITKRVYFETVWTQESLEQTNK